MTYYNKGLQKSLHFTVIHISISQLFTSGQDFLIITQDMFSLIRSPGNFVLILDIFSIIQGSMNYACGMAGIIKMIRIPMDLSIIIYCIFCTVSPVSPEE